MSELNLIKTVLFNAVTLSEALTRLTELGIQYRACTFTDNGYHVTGHDVTFWPTHSLRCPLAVCINGNLSDYDDRLSFLAGQRETAESTVPATSPETAGQRPIEFFREPADRFDYVKSYVKIPLLRNILRTERRLKNSQAKGHS